MRGVDERVAVVAEDAEAAVEVEIHRRRLQVGRVVRIDPDPPGLELRADVAIGQDAHLGSLSLLRRSLGEQLVNLALEVLEVLEALVDRCEADVGDVVQGAQLLHRERTDAGARDLRQAGAAQLALDRVGGALRGILGNRASGQRLRQPGRQLVAVELLAGAVALDDDQPRGLDALVRGEPGGAGGALAATADRSPTRRGRASPRRACPGYRTADSASSLRPRPTTIPCGTREGTTTCRG